MLGVDKATVTRLVQQQPALLGEDGLVDPEELRRVREATRHPGLQTRGAAAAPAGNGRSAGLNAVRERTEQAKAQTAELDLAERLGLTLRRDDVVASVAAAGQVMKQTASQLARDAAERLVRIDDVRAMERALDDLMREVLAKGAQALSLAAMPARKDDAA